MKEKNVALSYCYFRNYANKRYVMKCAYVSLEIVAPDTIR